MKRNIVLSRYFKNKSVILPHLSRRLSTRLVVMIPRRGWHQNSHCHGVARFGGRLGASADQASVWVSQSVQ